MVASGSDEFERLIAEAQSQKFSGWDFSWLGDRQVEGTLPWDYKQEVLKEFPKIRSLLDLGTGGGELLSSFGPLPRQTCAIEGCRHNVTVARDGLKPLHVDMVDSWLGNRAEELKKKQESSQKRETHVLTVS